MLKNIKNLFICIILNMTCLSNVYAEETQFELVYSKLPDSEFIKKETPETELEVFYFFSYGCPHCFTIHEYVNLYKESLSNKVSFHYVPLEIQEAWKEYAKAFYIAKSLKLDIEEDIFNQIHLKKQKLFTKEQLGDYFINNFNVPSEKFHAAYNSYSITYKIKQNEKLADEFNIEGTPSMVFIDKNNNVYKISPSITNGVFKMIETAVVLTYSIIEKGE